MLAGIAFFIQIFQSADNAAPLMFAYRPLLRRYCAAHKFLTQVGKSEWDAQ